MLRSHCLHNPLFIQIQNDFKFKTTSPIVTVYTWKLDMYYNFPCIDLINRGSFCIHLPTAMVGKAVVAREGPDLTPCPPAFYLPCLCLSLCHMSPAPHACFHSPHACFPIMPVTALHSLLHSPLLPLAYACLPTVPTFSTPCTSTPTYLLLCSSSKADSGPAQVHPFPVRQKEWQQLWAWLGQCWRHQSQNKGQAQTQGTGGEGPGGRGQA